MKKALLLVFLFICAFITLSNAQAGYIITQKNDTIKCEVKTSFFGYPKYKTNGSKAKQIDIEAIKEYQLTDDSTIYRAKIFLNNKKPEFVQLLERGTICLYGNEIQHGTAGSATDLYVTKNTDSLIALKIYGIGYTGKSHKERKDILFDLLSDNNQVASAYKAKNSFSFDNIRKYIRMYNQATTTK